MRRLKLDLNSRPKEHWGEWGWRDRETSRCQTFVDWVSREVQTPSFSLLPSAAAAAMASANVSKRRRLGSDRCICLYVALAFILPTPSEITSRPPAKIGDGPLWEIGSIHDRCCTSGRLFILLVKRINMIRDYSTAPGAKWVYDVLYCGCVFF